MTGYSFDVYNCEHGHWHLGVYVNDALIALAEFSTRTEAMIQAARGALRIATGTDFDEWVRTLPGVTPGEIPAIPDFMQLGFPEGF